ncbi:AraC family transcriptional regulator [Sinobacterium caligoides]|uniref:AraC family transcriptional regulator n=1 Tax=Sinobacterium caligoides TaxID=933926 RepID=A0A3N2DPF7_9GAMM|nr:helix-turn-helix domain-containing protein [Sinobacterium caligoides]ROS01698.1 AraC family transcriptional regulator [Sinobacterium caligoides]
MNYQQHSRINDVLYEIHRDISAVLTANKLAKVASYSEQHFHRVFHQVVGETLNHYIRRTRLEHAANQLMFDSSSSVQVIAEKCGFHSLSSFNQSFKKAFAVSPGRWRTVDRVNTKAPSYLQDAEIAAGYQRIQSRQLPLPELLQLDDQWVAYVRHQGYGRSIRLAWQTLQAWAAMEGRSAAKQLALHHSNPAWVPLPQCRYVACLGIDSPLVRRGVVNSMMIPGGLHAAFTLEGCYGDLLPYLSKIMEEWLPESGFKMQTTPALVCYEKNQFLAEDSCFKLTFYLPISLL